MDALLLRSIAEPGVVDMKVFAEFRAGLLRHIAMEEKVLLPEACRRNGEPLPIAKQLRADHAALASLLVPMPTHEIVAMIRGILEDHNPLEEGLGGMYHVCERLAGAELEALLARVRATPDVPSKPHFDGPRVHEHIARLLRARTLRPKE
jgi:hypothetical protein